jgi:hypothetical protein
MISGLLMIPSRERVNIFLKRLPILEMDSLLKTRQPLNTPKRPLET